MDSADMQPLVSITLTREELSLLPRLIEAGDLPGVRPEPDGTLGESTPDKEALGIIYAERSLRARGLAEIDEQGNLVVHEALLTMVAVCAYPDQFIFAFHTLQSGITFQLFTYKREGAIVQHSMPEPGLNTLSWMPDEASAVSHVLAFCGCDQLPQTTATPITARHDLLAQAKALAEDGDAQAAAHLLEEEGADAESARIITDALAGPHTVSVITLVGREPGDGSLLKREMTILHNEHTAWLTLQPPRELTDVTGAPQAEVGERAISNGNTSNDIEQVEYTLEPATTENVHNTLTDWLSTPSLDN